MYIHIQFCIYIWLYMYICNYVYIIMRIYVNICIYIFYTYIHFINPFLGVHLRRTLCLGGLIVLLCQLGFASNEFSSYFFWTRAIHENGRNTGWWFEPLWKIWKSIGMIIPNIWENKKCSKPPTRISVEMIVNDWTSICEFMCEFIFQYKCQFCCLLSMTIHFPEKWATSWKVRRFSQGPMSLLSKKKVLKENILGQSLREHWHVSGIEHRKTGWRLCLQTGRQSISVNSLKLLKKLPPEVPG